MFWLEGHIEAWWQNGSDVDGERVPVMVLGALDASKLLVCRGDTGELTTVPTDRVRLGWRYDAEAGRWIDIDHPGQGDDGGDAADF